MRGQFVFLLQSREAVWSGWVETSRSPVTARPRDDLSTESQMEGATTQLLCPILKTLPPFSFNLSVSHSLTQPRHPPPRSSSLHIAVTSASSIVMPCTSNTRRLQPPKEQPKPKPGKSTSFPPGRLPMSEWLLSDCPKFGRRSLTRHLIWL
jgi:hypothetical protein